jgi:hypothetical protein
MSRSAGGGYLGMKEEQSHSRGLVAVQESKTRRREGRLPAIPTRFWLWTLIVLIAWGIFYWRQTQAEIESQKAALFARQRGVVAEFGARFEPLRQRIEEWTVQSAGTFPGEIVAPELKGWDFTTQPGIYLRLRALDGGHVLQRSRPLHAAGAALQHPHGVPRHPCLGRGVDGAAPLGERRHEHEAARARVR